MELKQPKRKRYYPQVGGSNRTFMELKPAGGSLQVICFIVLIVPLWN